MLPLPLIAVALGRTLGSGALPGGARLPLAYMQSAFVVGHRAGMRHNSEEECTGAPCNLAGAAECSVAARKWQK